MIKKIILFIKYKLFTYQNRTIQIPKNVFSEKDNIIFRGTCHVGPGAYWDARGGIEVGNNVIIGPRSTLITLNHNYKSVVYIPYGRDFVKKPICIEDNVWVCINVTIVPGVTIEEGAIIAAGSVVTKNIPALAIAGGNPAKVLFKRNEQSYKKLKSEGKFYLDNKIRGFKDS